MKIEIERKALRIIPENIMDVAFIEDTLHLKEHGNSLELMRWDKLGDKGINYLEAEAKAVEKKERGR